VKAARSIVRLENPETPKIGPTQIKRRLWSCYNKKKKKKKKTQKPFLNDRTRCPVTRLLLLDVWPILIPELLPIYTTQK
jgi:hypothetical protein